MSNLFALPKPSLIAAHETATTPGSCSWKAKGKKKAGSVNSLIPLEWRIPGGAPSIKDQRDVRGPYIHQFLSPKEIEITETDAVEIVNKTSAGTWTAVEVITAFCHRAALAHQLVYRPSFVPFDFHDESLQYQEDANTFVRLIACTRYFSRTPSPMRNVLTRSSLSLKFLWAHFMVFLSV